MTPHSDIDMPQRAPARDRDLMQLCAYCEQHVLQPCLHDQYEDCDNFRRVPADDERRH